MLHGNSIELIGTYGGDRTHALSGWTSTHRDLTAARHQRMPTFLKTLASNGHHTPFEKSAIHFLMTTDLATHIHLLKHRIGVSVNSESARYMEQGAVRPGQNDKFYLPSDWIQVERERLERHVLRCYSEYHAAVERLVAQGHTRSRAKESARFYLPYAFQYTVDVMFNFRSFMHFQGLRNHPHAQLEIRELAVEALRLVTVQRDFRFSIEAFHRVVLPAATWEMIDLP